MQINQDNQVEEILIQKLPLKILQKQIRNLETMLIKIKVQKLKINQVKLMKINQKPKINLKKLRKNHQQLKLIRISKLLKIWQTKRRPQPKTERVWSANQKKIHIASKRSDQIIVA